MPWIKDINNESKYIPSIFVKEELPTWNEMYEDFWLGKVYDYDKTKCTEYTKYWNIPIKLFILGIACNQLNKMILESEDIKRFIVDKYNENMYFSKLRYDDEVYFSLNPIENNLCPNIKVENFTI